MSFLSYPRRKEIGRIEGINNTGDDVEFWVFVKLSRSIQ